MRVRIPSLPMLPLSFYIKITANSQQYASSAYWLKHLITTQFGSRSFFAIYYPKSTSHATALALPPVYNHFTLYFFKKELFYTKLKYSRVPQFDTSAGAAASFLSGLYGFMVCEKFGLELLDGGDFLFTALYLLWTFFVGVLYVQIFNTHGSLGSSIYAIFLSFKFY